MNETELIKCIKDQIIGIKITNKVITKILSDINNAKNKKKTYIIFEASCIEKFRISWNLNDNYIVENLVKIPKELKMKLYAIQMIDGINMKDMIDDDYNLLSEYDEYYTYYFNKSKEEIIDIIINENNELSKEDAIDIFNEDMIDTRFGYVRATPL